MFSNLTSYFFGGGSATSSSTPTANGVPSPGTDGLSAPPSPAVVAGGAGIVVPVANGPPETPASEKNKTDGNVAVQQPQQKSPTSADVAAVMVSKKAVLKEMRGERRQRLATKTVDDQRMVIVDDDDDDWLMVDNSSAGTEDEKMEEEEEDVREEVEEKEQLHHPLPRSTASITTTYAAVASSSTHGGPSAIDESWIIPPAPLTTLPCVLDSAMQVSPMETMLIEHPSMSVYMKLDTPDHLSRKATASPHTSPNPKSTPNTVVPSSPPLSKPTPISPKELSTTQHHHQSKPEVPTIASTAADQPKTHLSSPSASPLSVSTITVQPIRSQESISVSRNIATPPTGVRKSSNQQKSSGGKQPHKPPQIPFILKQRAQKNGKSFVVVPEPDPHRISTATFAVNKTLGKLMKPPTAAAAPAPPKKNKKIVKPEVVPNKLPKVKSKNLTTTNTSSSVVAVKDKKKTSTVLVTKQPLSESRRNIVVNNHLLLLATTSSADSNDNHKPEKLSKKSSVVVKKFAPPMNRLVESNIKEMYPTHVYPKDMRPFVEDFQNNGSGGAAAAAATRQHRELITAQRRAQQVAVLTRAKRQAASRRAVNPFSAETLDEVAAAAMMEQKENVLETRRQDRFEILLRSSQKQQQKRIDQSLRKNRLHRSNKVVHEMSARNKRQRRNDHSNKPSGANNNRKSQ